MKLTGRHLAAARAALGMTMQELADAAGLKTRITVARLEATGAEEIAGKHAGSLAAVREVLEAEGITFIGGVNPGVRWRA